MAPGASQSFKIVSQLVINNSLSDQVERKKMFLRFLRFNFHWGEYQTLEILCYHKFEKKFYAVRRMFNFFGVGKVVRHSLSYLM